MQWQTCQSSDTLIWFIIFRNVGCAFCLHEINTTALRPFMRRVETFQDNMLILSYHVTLLDTGQNSTSVDVKLTPLNWRPALYSWQKRVFPAELHQLCVNNQALTCGVKPCNWSDTSKRRLAPSPSGKTLHASNKADKGGGLLMHMHRHRHALPCTMSAEAKEGGNSVPGLCDTVGVPILLCYCCYCLILFYFMFLIEI